MLQVHRSEDAATLVEALADILASAPGPTAAPLDPLAPEVVCVPTRGIERWIAQELALRLGATAAGADGVAANIRFPSPARLISEILAAAVGEPSIGKWREEQLVWPVMAAIDASLGESAMRVVTRFVRGEGDQAIEGRRAEAALRIARLFATYDRERPDLVRAWADGRDVGADGLPVGEEWAWQPPLWRRVRRAIGAPSLAECLPDALGRLAAGAPVPSLPSRVCVYGLTALPLGYLQVLSALALHRDVYLLLLHPSPALWASVEALIPVPAGLPPLRSADATEAVVMNPLLRSWGRDVRELQALTAACGMPASVHHVAQRDEPQTLLQRLQEDVRRNRRPPGPAATPKQDARPLLGPDDRSVQIPACHGPRRQVEVLRDTILHLLADDPTLEPRDVVIMCPDVETYAPLVEAAFRPDAPAGGDDPLPRVPAGIPDIRCRVADRAPVATNPLAGLTVALLELARSRVTAGAVLAFAALEPVRRRFRSDEFLGLMVDLVDDAEISWGVDEGHRADHGLPDRPERTWAEGLDRLFAGLMTADRKVELIGGRLPLAGVEGDEVDAVDRLAEMLFRLGAAIRQMRVPMPADQWRQVLGEATRSLGDVPRGDRWQWLSLQRLLDRLLPQEHEYGAALSLPEVLMLLSPLAQGRPSRVNHRTGDLTVCTLTPMRSVPHRVVCLLGMDDMAFPRSAGEDGDDVLTLAPAVGSRDSNGEDRQLLLDALMAARDHLVVLYSGHDERTNAAMPPAVPIAELIEAVGLTVQFADPAQEGSPPIVVEHPLQPFDPANFLPAPGRRPGFDRRMLDAARAMAAAPKRPRRPVPELSEHQWEVLTLTELRAFLEHPARAFAATRLGFRYPDEPKQRDDTLPVELTGLEHWGVGQRLLDGVLAGLDWDALVGAEWGRGTLPPQNLGALALQPVEATVRALRREAAAVGLALPAVGSCQIDLALPGGRRLTGTLGGLTGNALATVQYARVQPKHLAAAYLRLLALTAADPATAWWAALVGREMGSGDGVCSFVLAPLGASSQERRRGAGDRLEMLLDLYGRGMRRPLPMTMTTSFDYAGESDPERGLRQAAQTWDDPFNRTPEAEDPHHLLAFGGLITFEELLAEEPRDDERGPGWPEAPTRFEVLARRLWEPIFEMLGSGR